MTLLRHASRIGVSLLLALVACDNPLTPRSAMHGVVPDPRANIADGAHGGNSHFFFLPPMVSAPRFAGQSDDSVSPTVMVCEWNAEQQHCGNVVAAFGRGDGSAPDQITYDAVSGAYQVNWKTDVCLTGPCALDLSKTYRLRVLVGHYELGHADLQIVSSGKQLKNVDTGEYIGLVDGRTLPVKFRVEKGAVAAVKLGGTVTMNAQGGAVATEDGSLTLTFPEGALSSATEISVKAVAEKLPGVAAWSTPIDLGPTGTTFASPVTLKLQYDANKLPAGVPETALAVYTWTPDGWAEVPGSMVDETENTVSAPISHFSYYSLMIRPNSFTIADGGDLMMLVGDSTEVRAQFTYRATVNDPFIPMAGYRVSWYTMLYAPSSSPPASIAAFSSVYSITDANGETTSPMLLALAPGVVRLNPQLADAGFIGPTVTVLPPVATVAVDPPTAFLALTGAGSTQQLVATLKDASGNTLSGRTVVWSSSDVSVAKVDASGVVTAVATGKATITAASGGRIGTATVTVGVLDPNAYTIVFSVGSWDTPRGNDIYMERSDGSGRVNLTNTPDINEWRARPSPDGKQIVFERENDVYIMDAKPNAVATNLTHGIGGFNGDPRFSPDGKRIYFSSSRSGNYDVWVMNVDGTLPKQLTTSPYDEGNAYPSRDGKQVAFVRTSPTGYDVWVMGANGGNERQITRLGNFTFNPAWSKDGTRIVFAHDFNIYIVNADGQSPPIMLATTGGRNQQPDWSLDGKRIIFTNQDLYTMNPDGTDQRPIAVTNDAIENYPSFVPPEGSQPIPPIPVDADSYTLSFSAGAVNSGVENIFMQTTGSADATRVALTTGAFDDQSGHWSRNGTRLLLTSNRSGGGAWELYMLDAVGGGTPRRISTAGGLTGYGDLSWADPSTAVFMRGYRIWTMNVDASNPDATAVQITSTPFDENEPKYSPDGQWITWVRQPRAGTDVWVMNANDPSQAFQVTDLGDYARNPSWSPDGMKIVFSRKYDIYVADVIDPATGRVRALADVRITRLTFDGSWNDTPVWSPDGRKIVWSAEPAAARGQTDLMMMNADGTGVPERITFTTGINEAWPAFRPRRCDPSIDPGCDPSAP